MKLHEKAALAQLYKEPFSMSNNWIKSLHICDALKRRAGQVDWRLLEVTVEGCRRAKAVNERERLHSRASQEVSPQLLIKSSW